jgi:hypothetical protein
MPTFDTPEPITVAVELGLGDVRLLAGERTDTVVDVQPSDRNKRDDVSAAENTQIELTNGRLVVKVARTWRRYSWFSDGGSVDICIELPAGSQVGVDAGMGALHASGRLGSLRCKTGMGDVDLDEVGALDLRTGMGHVTVGTISGRADVKTGSGTVRIGVIDGAAEVKSSDGDTRLGEVSGEVRVKAANGDIVIDRAGAAVTAKTANGAVRLGEVVRGAVSAETAYGDISVGIGSGTAAWLDVHTQYGHVDNRLDAAPAAGPGDDTAEVRAHTSAGDITIHRSAGSSGPQTSTGDARP